MKTAVVLAVASFLAFGQPVQAQQSGKALELSPFFGYLYGGKVTDFDVSPGSGITRFNLRYDLADHASYGLRIGYKVGSHLEPEIQWSRTETGLRSRGSFKVGDLCLQTDCLKLDYFLGGITYNFMQGRTRPYVSLSAGAATLFPTYSYDLTSNKIRSDTRFAAGLGAGVKSFITPSVGLRLDVHGYTSRLNNIRFGPTCTTFTSDPGQPVIPVTSPCPTRGWLINGEFSGGLLVAF